MGKVKFFAALREAAGTGETSFDQATVAELLDALRRRFGDGFSRSLAFCKVAVNGTLIEQLDGEQTRLAESDEVALLPPVSGG